jgi:hypothetical protein
MRGNEAIIPETVMNLKHKYRDSTPSGLLCPAGSE